MKHSAHAWKIFADPSVKWRSWESTKGTWIKEAMRKKIRLQTGCTAQVKRKEIRSSYLPLGSECLSCLLC